MDNILKKQLKESRYIKRGIKPELEHAAETGWLKKEVLNSRLLPLAENFDALVQHGPGVMSVSDMSRTGKGSIHKAKTLCIEAPTSTAIKNPSNRGYATSGFTRPLDGEDITDFNRLSLWIYIESEGFYTNFISISLNNQGEHIMPVPGRFEGSHHVALEPFKWRHVAWEFPYLYRDNVTGFTVSYNLLGALPQGADKIKMYVDDMRLETVKPEHYKGFALAEDKMAYCHSGYKTDAIKQALVQNCDINYFELRNEQNDTVYKNETKELATGFKLLDFSGFKTPGKYTIYTEKISSKPFHIGENAYLSAAWKALNFYYLERCGADIPGVHAECHQDATCHHPDGRRLLVCGGWHDAADLTQDLTNTIESAFFMLDLAESVKDKDKLFYERIMEEARWGLNWVMRTRFGDGYRHTGMVIGIWTKNIFGDKDDMSQIAENRPFANFMAAMLCAKAARMFREHDSVFASWCAKCAREDFAFGREYIGVPKGEVSEVILYSQAVAASVEMYKTFADPEYIKAGAEYAKIVMQCQEKSIKPGFILPLTGYFYETREKSRILAFYHRSYEHLPVQALSGLSEIAGEHDDAELWRESVNLYASYIKAAAELIEPYNILPAAIYEIDNTDFKNIYHEGAKDKGAPSLEEYNAQVRNGIKISDTHYLRRFPVAYQYRGFHATLLSKAKAAMIASKTLNDNELRDRAVRQVEWVLGFNPFASSSMYGEGHDYHPLYVAASNQIVGAVPVGFETFENEDEPYYPMQNNATYKEIWVHSTGRMMWLLSDLL